LCAINLFPVEQICQPRTLIERPDRKEWIENKAGKQNKSIKEGVNHGNRIKN
jgi:hypothetical protein